jgi:hypothetical protein
MCTRYMGILAYYTSRSGHPDFAYQSVSELRNEKQEICYTRNSYTKINDEIDDGEIGKKDHKKIDRYAGF